LDDYCPRERRLTNHAVVAMIEEDIKQTRCTTCDAEHAYKGGKIPRRRKQETPSALYKEVLAGHLAADGGPLGSDLPSDTSEEAGEAVAPIAAEPAPMAAAAEHDAVGDSAPADPPEEIEEQPGPVEEGPVHRPLIRAQLPRVEGQKEERRLPEFTIRQRAAGNGHFRGGMKAHRPAGHGPNPRGGNGNRAHGGSGSRFAGQRFRSGGGRKRSR
jgi:hypothetical protein